MSVQARVIKRYLNIHENPTLKYISEDTQIQMTRVFRLINGSQMKLNEYLKFQNSINKKLGITSSGHDFLKMAESCLDNLSAHNIKELMDLMNRKMELKSILG